MLGDVGAEAGTNVCLLGLRERIIEHQPPRAGDVGGQINLISIPLIRLEVAIGENLVLGLAEVVPEFIDVGHAVARAGTLGLLQRVVANRAGDLAVEELDLESGVDAFVGRRGYGGAIELRGTAAWSVEGFGIVDVGA